MEDENNGRSDTVGFQWCTTLPQVSVVGKEKIIEILSGFIASYTAASLLPHINLRYNNLSEKIDMFTVQFTAIYLINAESWYHLMV